MIDLQVSGTFERNCRPVIDCSQNDESDDADVTSQRHSSQSQSSISNEIYSNLNHSHLVNASGANAYSIRGAVMPDELSDKSGFLIRKKKMMKKKLMLQKENET